MGLSPNILFHFTKSKTGLHGILKETFKLSYARERIYGQSSSREFAIPMVSFCDLRISELKTHMLKYGRFGIGLTKQWATTKGLNPVFYVDSSSHFTENFFEGINSVFDTIDLPHEVDSSSLVEAYSKLLNTYRYMKNYQGDLKRGKKLIKDYRFADEREWRYVPPFSETNSLYAFVPAKKMQTKSDKIMYNKKIKDLRFEPDDIQYLVVKDENDIIPLLTHLKTVKLRFDDATIRRLSSRILTSKQIIDDI